MSDIQAINIVEDAEGELRVSSLIIAQQSNNEHRAVLQLIRNNQSDLEQLGHLAFEMHDAYQGHTSTVYLLNEQQATLIITYMRNSDVVRAFKLALVKEFYRMRQALTAPRPVAELDRRQLALMVIEAEDARDAAEQRAIEMQPKADYVDRFVGKRSDLVKVEVFASQFGSTGPKVRELLIEKRLAVRRFMGERWSRSKQCMVDEYEWRPRQGVSTADWFDILPQHNAPRLHNGQVRQTMYIRQYHAQDLAQKLGLVEGVAS